MRLKIREDLIEENDLLLAEALMILDYRYSGDYDKMKKWISDSNMNFGGSRPIDLILSGNVKKVLLFLKALKEGH